MLSLVPTLDKSQDSVLSMLILWRNYGFTSDLRFWQDSFNSKPYRLMYIRPKETVTA